MARVCRNIVGFVLAAAAAVAASTAVVVVGVDHQPSVVRLAGNGIGTGSSGNPLGDDNGTGGKPQGKKDDKDEPERSGNSQDCQQNSLNKQSNGSNATTGTGADGNSENGSGTETRNNECEAQNQAGGGKTGDGKTK
ncbi:hypothetical protein IU500_16075 [Nocardia terpenica]|uniref:hypothetical protein n=1 Tax=Nocardia terpenica TaxID=455432 RepID=UPI0018932614|nr:hypothetical protein [Nocardia terpenica]MBF6061211.1 hypothetical protein [Nocardia terpenica]MBF6105560.1 hypothetical protein [Nocardia terpenica]MBF6112970.1 hypothetical protein [Nocardia terpenica]MBF6119100.1 hypothetical protein [Nocardia terpenica]MBF6152748.1 hypothetical protein [Nocardia terpenica]